MAQAVKYQGVDKESSGYKLLAAMGWQEGSGLVSVDKCLLVGRADCLLLMPACVAGSQTTGHQGACQSQEEA